MVVLISFLTACSPIDLLGNLPDPNTTRSITAVSYGDDPRQKLDIYAPVTLKEKAPIIIFFYGGSWASGSRDDYVFLARTLTEMGYITVIPDYRIYPQVRFPSFLEDGAAAIAFVKNSEQVKDLGGDTNRIFLMGHSAGGYNAAMLSYEQKYLAKHNISNKSLKGFIGLAGGYDFYPYIDERTTKIFSGFKPELTQPVRKIDRGEPPALLLHGTQDDLVLIRNSRNLDKALRKKEIKSKLVELENMGHKKIIASLSPYLIDKNLLEKIKNFIEANK